MTDKNSDNLLLRYAGLATQFLISIGLGVFIGMKADGWLKFSIPLLVWIFPLIIIVAVIVKLIMDTSKKR